MVINLDDLMNGIIDEIKSSPDMNTKMFDRRAYTHAQWLFVEQGIKYVIQKTVAHIDSRLSGEYGLDVGIVFVEEQSGHFDCREIRE